MLLISGAGRISPNAAKAAGAAGFVSKDWPAADIAGAVRMVGLGMTVFRPHEAPGGPPLTDREREVLDLIASGATNREIAGRLYLSPHTIKEHTSLAVPQARRPQPRRGRAEGPAARPHRLATTPDSPEWVLGASGRAAAAPARRTRGRSRSAS